MDNYSIVRIDARNMAKHPQAICYINPKHPSYGLKVEWLKKRLDEGLVVKLFYPQGESKAQGFIEYVPGENAWRAVSAHDYMLIHCLWVYAGAFKNKGIGGILLEECYQEAKSAGMAGVAVLSSSGAFMAKSGFFQKKGFQVVDTAPPGYELLVRQIRPAAPPRINNRQSSLEAFTGLHIVYSRQCPWVARFVQDLDAWLGIKSISATVTELKTAAQAQAAPSPYTTFNLIHNGRLLADHYISQTRFANILRKEKLL